jgi:hypothetical protein
MENIAIKSTVFHNARCSFYKCRRPRVQRLDFCMRARLIIISKSTRCCRDLVDVDAALAQLNFRQLDLLLQLGVCLGHVVKCKDRETQTAQEIASEDDNRVEGELVDRSVSVPVCSRG